MENFLTLIKNHLFQAGTGGALRVSLWELGGGFTGYNLENFLGAYGAN